MLTSVFLILSFWSKHGDLTIIIHHNLETYVFQMGILSILTAYIP